MIAPLAGIGPLGPAEWKVGGVTGLGDGVGAGVGTAGVGGAAAAGAPGSFGAALSNAVSSLEASQATASQAAQGLATGQVSDPTQAVTAVENAALEMDYAAQIRTKVDDAVTTLFQTQV